MSCAVRFIHLAAIAALLSACATTGSGVTVDKAEGETVQCESFAWHAPSQEAASFTDQRVRAAAMNALKTKGYAETAENPSCRISYVLSTREIPKSRPGVGVGVGGGSGGLGGGIGVTLPIGRKKGETGRFTLDVIDAKKNAQVWSGTVEGTFGSSELSEEEAQSMVEQVLAEFPNRVGNR